MSQENPESQESPANALIQDVSAWVLRIGVILSVAVMLLGTVISFVHNSVSVQEITTFPFDYRPAVIWHGILTLRGRYIIEAGIYLLVLTPVMRVAMSMVLFIFAERDWLYAVVTLVVLLLTLAGLLFM